MNILAIDTATDFISVAYSSSKGILEETIFAPKTHSEILPSVVARILKEADARISDIQLVAVSVGPGSYTGLRVGIAFAQGFCLQNGIKISPVGTLDAMAMRTEKPGNSVAPILDARSGKIYSAIFDTSIFPPQTIVPPKTFNIDEFLSLNLAKDTIITGTGLLTLKERFQEHGLTIADEKYWPPSAEKIAILAEYQKAVPPENIEPIYLREFIRS